MSKKPSFTLPAGMGSIDSLDDAGILDLAERILHRSTQGLEGIGEAVARRLVEVRRKECAACSAGPEDHEALAGALLLHARWLLASQRPEDALAAERESVKLARQLVGTGEGTTGAVALGCSLRSLGASLLERGESEEAMASYEEAVSMLRKAQAAGDGGFEPDLATGLAGLGNVLDAAKRPADAAVAFGEAAELMRPAMATEDAEQVRPVLASILRNHAHCLLAVEKYDEAMAPARESADLFGLLAKSEPADFGVEHALALGTLGVLLRRKEEPAKAAPLFLAGVESMVASLQASHTEEVSEEDDGLLRSLVEDYAESCEDAGLEVNVAALEGLLGGPADVDPEAEEGGRIILP
jgi:tetratricopeptide (TPR) repeat protein